MSICMSMSTSRAGAEALFADLGHFSRPSIQLAFISFVFPCLVVTYLGQASFLMHSPDTYATIYWSSIPKPVSLATFLYSNC